MLLRLHPASKATTSESVVMDSDTTLWIELNTIESEPTALMDNFRGHSVAAEGYSICRTSNPSCKDGFS